MGGPLIRASALDLPAGSILQSLGGRKATPIKIKRNTTNKNEYLTCPIGQSTSGFQAPPEPHSRFQRLVSAVLVATLLFGCRFLNSSGSNPFNSTNPSIPASQIQLPIGASQADLDQAEGRRWQALRAPLTDELGPATIDLFGQADALRAQMLTQAAQDLSLSQQTLSGPGCPNLWRLHR